MPIHDTFSSAWTGSGEFDVIIAGGGAAGCVVAGRLAMADPSLRILVIELGPDNHQDPAVRHPLMFHSHLLPESPRTIVYRSSEQPQLAGRKLDIQAGGVLGGGSSINMTVYARGQRSDYDSWNTPGWSTDELIPYFKKFENYHGPTSAVHGDSGPIHVSKGPHQARAWIDDVITAATIVGYPEKEDLQDFQSSDGFQRWMKYVTPEGIRQDAAHAFVHPLLQDDRHPNLHVLVHHQVVKVLLDVDMVANGVEITPTVTPKTRQGLSSAGQTQKPVKHIVRASRMVVLSSGPCGSPAILERSGIGGKSIVEGAGVKSIIDLPGVGHSFQDHPSTPYVYNSTLDEKSHINAFFTGGKDFSQAIAAGDPMAGWNLVDVCGKIRPTEEDMGGLDAEFRDIWDKDYRNIDKPLILLGVVQASAQLPYGPNGLPNIAVGVLSSYPYSRGSIHITGPETTDPLDFDIGYFTDKNDFDIKAQVWGYKKGREIMRRTKHYNGEITAGHPAFPTGSKAACIEGAVPREDEEGAVRDLEYSAEDDVAIMSYIRENVKTGWHSLGTAKMASREAMGVVDPSLSVHGTQRLKVVDLSIVPENVGANTINTAFMIGEKGADIILADLGLK